MRILLITTIFVCTSSSMFTQTIQPPAGYRLPTESDFTGDWKDNRATNPMPFHAAGDYNGDGVQDEALLLLRTSGRGFAVFAVIGSRTGSSKLIQLTFAPNESWDNHYIETAKPARYDTACGKGLATTPCEHGQPDELNLKHSSIWFCRFGSACSLFWWDTKTKKFHQTLISD
jgi:hypothetical protein